jgi:glycosyltransferase involved in cell wall biosynthesis
MNIQISVIIPTYQRKRYVIDNIVALKNQTFEGSFEVICIVDGSTDGTTKALTLLNTPFPLSIIYQENKGAAAARNAGATIARGDILLFLDDDMEAEPNLLTEHLKSHIEGANIVTGQMPYHHSVKSTPFPDSFINWSELRTSKLIKKTQPDFVDFLTGQVSVQKNLFFSVNGFDEEYTFKSKFGHEDIDLGYRLLKTGKARFVFNPKAISFQRFDISLRKDLERQIMLGYNHVYFVRKNPETYRILFENRKLNKWQLKIFNMYISLSLLFPSINYLISNLITNLTLFIFRTKANNKIKNVFYLITIRLNYWRGVVMAKGIPLSALI